MAYSREAIGRRLRSGMVDKGIEIQEMAQLTGISRYTIQDYCSGKNGMSLENAQKFCDVLDWPLDRLTVRGPYADQETEPITPTPQEHGR